MGEGAPHAGKRGTRTLTRHETRQGRPAKRGLDATATGRGHRSPGGRSSTKPIWRSHGTPDYYTGPLRRHSRRDARPIIKRKMVGKFTSMTRKQRNKERRCVNGNGAPDSVTPPPRQSGVARDYHTLKFGLREGIRDSDNHNHQPACAGNSGSDSRDMASGVPERLLNQGRKHTRIPNAYDPVLRTAMEEKRKRRKELRPTTMGTGGGAITAMSSNTTVTTRPRQHRLRKIATSDGMAGTPYPYRQTSGHSRNTKTWC